MYKDSTIMAIIVYVLGIALIYRLSIDLMWKMMIFILLLTFIIFCMLFVSILRSRKEYKVFLKKGISGSFEYLDTLIKKSLSSGCKNNILMDKLFLCLSINNLDGASELVEYFDDVLGDKYNSNFMKTKFLLAIKSNDLLVAKNLIASLMLDIRTNYTDENFNKTDKIGLYNFMNKVLIVEESNLTENLLHVEKYF